MQKSLLVAEGRSPLVKQIEDLDSVKGGELINGIFTGIVEVFPYESNQVRCKSNFTQGYDAFRRMFIDEPSWNLSEITVQ